MNKNENGKINMKNRVDEIEIKSKIFFTVGTSRRHIFFFEGEGPEIRLKMKNLNRLKKGPSTFF